MHDAEDRKQQKQTNATEGIIETHTCQMSACNACSRPACNACRSKKIQSVHARRVQPTVKKKEISNKATN